MFSQTYSWVQILRIKIQKLVIFIICSKKTENKITKNEQNARGWNKQAIFRLIFLKLKIKSRYEKYIAYLRLVSNYYRLLRLSIKVVFNKQNHHMYHDNVATIIKNKAHYTKRLRIYYTSILQIQ